MPIRVLLVDDHPIVLQGLQSLFERQGDMTVVAACPDAAAALEAMRAHQPDVAVVDLRLRGPSGVDLLRSAAAGGLACRTVLLSASISRDEALAALELGAAGLVLKESPPESLVACVRKVHRGEQWIDQDTAVGVFRRALDREAAVREFSRTLTPRELEIVGMVAQGLRNKTVAERLSISEGTVKVHLHHIYEKLQVDGRLELVLCAQQKGLV